MAKRTDSTNSTNSKKTCFIYTRVSTAKQVDGVSLEQQEARARAHAERNGWEVLGVYSDEGISGRESIEDRPGLNGLIKATELHPDAVVVVYSITRLARSQRLLLTLLDESKGCYGLVVSSATEAFDTSTPWGRALVGILGVFSQLEVEMVSQRTKDALAHVKAKGKRLGAPSIAHKDPDTVRLIKRLKNENKLSYTQIADYLEANNIPTPRGGKRWYDTTITAALRANITGDGDSANARD